MQPPSNSFTQENYNMSLYERLVQETEASRNAFLSIPVLQRALRGEVSHDEYLAFLGQAYHHVSQTVPLLMGFGYNLPERLQWLQDAVAEYIEEEKGHEKWILDDIRSCGGDADAVRLGKPLPATELMVAYAHDVVQRRNPIGFFGMVFVLEGTSAQLATRAAGAIEQQLGLPKSAFRYLTSHGTLDLEHVDFYQGLVNQLDDAADQDALIHAANMFYQLYGDIFRAVSAATEH
jgi:pyrroloquinoline quinone (PQQ) biosynthesis protein C